VLSRVIAVDLVFALFFSGLFGSCPFHTLSIVRNEGIAKINCSGILPGIQILSDFDIFKYQHSNVLNRCKNKKPDFHFSISKQNSLILRSILNIIARYCNMKNLA